MKHYTNKKLIVLIILAFGFSESLLAQYWDEHRSTGHKNSVKVFFEDTSNAKIVTWEKVYQTNDLAQTWTELKTITGSGFPRFNDATKSSAKHYRLCDNKGKVWVTDDDFASWNSYSTGAGAFSNIDFPDDNNGYGIRNGYLYSSSNGGQTWTYKGGPNGDKFKSMLFTSSTTGFVAIDDRISTDTILYKTTNGGSSWTPVLFNGFLDSAQDWVETTCMYKSGSRIVLGYEAGIMLKSEDNGATWEFIRTPATNKDVVAADFYDKDLGIIGFEDGHCLETKDGGKTYTGMDSKNVWGTFSSFNILKPGKYFQMDVRNRHSVYTGRKAAGMDEWIVVKEGGTERYEGVKYAAKNVLYGYSSKEVIRSTDNGGTWNSTTYNTNPYLSTFMAPADANTCFFAHKKWRSGSVIKKVSGGLAQISDVVIPNTDTLGEPTMIKFITPKMGYFSFLDEATGNSTVYQTKDGGANWSKVTLSLPFSTSNNDTLCLVDDIQFFDTSQKKGVMVGKGKIGFLYIGWVGFTSDGGANWTYELKFSVGQISPFHGVRSLRGDTFGVVAGQNTYNLWSGGQSNRASKLPLAFSNEMVVHNRTSTDDGTGNFNNDPFTHHMIPTLAFPEPRSMDVYAGKDTNWIVGVGHEGLIYRMHYYGTGAMPWQVPGSSAGSTGGGGTAPAAPSGAAIVNVRRTNEVVNITWNDNSSDEDGFKLYKSTDGTNFTVVQTLTVDAVSVNDSFLNEKTNYYYKLTAFNANGESSFSNTVQIETLTDVGELEKLKMDFYPNPVGNILNVTGNVRLVRLYNLQGQMILESNSNSIDISHLKNGIYLVEMNSGSQKSIRRMVK